MTIDNILYISDCNLKIVKKYENVQGITRISEYYRIFIIKLDGTAINKSKEFFQKSWADKRLDRQDPEFLRIIDENIVEILSDTNNIVIITNSGKLYSYDIKNKRYDLMKRIDNLDVVYAGYVLMKIKST